MDFSAPNPQQNGSQSANTRSNDQQRSPIPPFTHKEVLESLKDEDDRDILAWLRLTRSLRTISEYSSYLPRLTPAQLCGLRLLRDCNADEVSETLRRVRTLRAIQTSTASASHYIRDQGPNQEPEGSSILSDASLPSLFVTSPQGGAHQQNLTQDPAAQPSLATTAWLVQGYKYFCTYCDTTEAFKFRSAWKLHEFDHRWSYVCTLNGATEATSQGMKCAFCRELDPSEGHLSTHNAQICCSESSRPFSCKGSEDMVKHLYKAHHVETNIPFVYKWKDNVDEQAWSCGFCVTAFADFDHRLRHIASHYEQGQTIDEWDTTKVIQGLLEQPGVINAWKAKLESLLSICWEKRAVETLRRDLEVGPNSEKTAIDLAEAAFAASQVKIRCFDMP